MLSEDQIRLVIALVISIPLSYPIRYLPSRIIRSLYSFTLGTTLQYYVYGTDIWLTFLQHLIVYFLIKLKGRRSGALITGYSMVTLFAYHIYRMIVDYGGWTLDISTIMMTMVCKYSLFAYAYQDGGQSNEQLKPEQAHSKLEQLPNIFDYLGYCQFVPTAVTGTAFQYVEYHKFMSLYAPYDKVTANFKLILFTFGESLFYVLFYVLGLIVFPMPYMKQPQFVEKGFWFICYYSYFSVTLLRFKYYFGWKLSMCSIHASTISYNELTKQFDKINTCNPVIVETSIHMRDRIANWNISCQEWLRKCIYERVGFKDKSNSALATFLVSAFWHGSYTGYYVSFFLWFAQVHLATLAFKQTKRKHSPWVKLYNMFGKAKYVILWTLLSFLMTNNGLYFQVLQGVVCLRIANALYWIPIATIFIGIFLFTFIKGKSSKKEPQGIEIVPSKEVQQTIRIEQKQAKGE